LAERNHAVRIVKDDLHVFEDARAECAGDIPNELAVRFVDEYKDKTPSG